MREWVGACVRVFFSFGFVHEYARSIKYISPVGMVECVSLKHNFMLRTIILCIL